MPIGGSEKKLILDGSEDEAFERVRRALEQVGKCKDADRSERRVKGSIRYGLQKVLVKAQVSEEGGKSSVTFKSQGDDVWGMGAKKVLQRWLEATDGSR